MITHHLWTPMSTDLPVRVEVRPTDVPEDPAALVVVRHRVVRVEDLCPSSTRARASDTHRERGASATQAPPSETSARHDEREGRVERAADRNHREREEGRVGDADGGPVHRRDEWEWRARCRGARFGVRRARRLPRARARARAPASLFRATHPPATSREPQAHLPAVRLRA